MRQRLHGRHGRRPRLRRRLRPLTPRGGGPCRVATLVTRLLLAAPLLTACEPPDLAEPLRLPEGPTRSWRCQDGRELITVTGPLPEELYLDQPGQVTRLVRLATASGIKYGNGPTIFWINGNAATLDTVIGGQATSCTAR